MSPPADTPREYDRECTDRISETTRIRTGYTHDRGTGTRFVYQLEYRVDDEWQTVVRYDHDPASEHGHDVSEEGLHIDAYRDGEQHRTEYVSPPMQPNDALSRAEDRSTTDVETFLERFE